MNRRTGRSSDGILFDIINSLSNRRQVLNREFGATRSSADWDWKARFAPKAAPRNAKTVPDTFYSLRGPASALAPRH
jgi:hypothetical protein